MAAARSPEQRKQRDALKAQIEELRRALDGIKASGKDVYAHADALVMMRTLALAAGASRISVTPTAIMMVTGFNAESPYVRGLLDARGLLVKSGTIVDATILNAPSSTKNGPTRRSKKGKPPSSPTARRNSPLEA